MSRLTGTANDSAAAATMFSKTLISRVATVAVTGAGAVALLVGCGAGQVSQTSRQEKLHRWESTQSKETSRFAMRMSGDPRVRTWHKGDDVPLAMVLNNQGKGEDQLTAVTSADATNVVLVHGQDGDNAAQSPTPGADASANAFPLVAGDASTQMTPKSEGEKPEAALPVNAVVRLQDTGTGSSYLVLQSIKRSLTDSSVIKVRLTFARAGQSPCRSRLRVFSRRTRAAPLPTTARLTKISKRDTSRTVAWAQNRQSEALGSASWPSRNVRLTAVPIAATSPRNGSAAALSAKPGAR